MLEFLSDAIPAIFQFGLMILYFSLAVALGFVIIPPACDLIEKIVSDPELSWLTTSLCAGVYLLYVIAAYQGMGALFDLPYPTGEPDKTWGGWS